jgi:hypothetical protein
MLDKAGGNTWLQQIGKMLEKIRRCKIDKRGKTTREKKIN